MSKSEQSSVSSITPSHPRLQPDCDAARELIPAYAFGLADPDEAALVEASLPHCPDLAVELESYTALAAPLAASVPQIAPPPSLYGKLMNAAEQARPSVASAGGLSTTAHPASTESGVRTASPVPGNVTPFPSSNQNRSRGGRLLVIVAAVAAVLTLFALNVLVLTNTLSSQTQLTDRLESQTAMLALFAQDEVLEFEMRDPQNADNPTRAVVLCHPEETVAVIRAENFPEAEDSYKVWLWDSGQRIDGGTLHVGQNGRGTLVLQAPLPLKHYDYIGIAQPASANPDNAPQTMLRGALYPVDETPPTPTP